MRDISDRKLAQARLQAQVERLQLLDQITRAIGERQALQSIYQVAIRSLEERLPVDFSCVCRYDAADDALTVIRVGANSQALAMELAMDEQSIIGIDRNGLSRCVRGELVHEPDIEAVPFLFPSAWRAVACARWWLHRCSRKAGSSASWWPPARSPILQQRATANSCAS